jgi:hypothetical protein
MGETAFRARRSANRRGDTWNADTQVNGSRLLGVLVISSGLVSPAIAQKPRQAQINAVRQACPIDY